MSMDWPLLSSAVLHTVKNHLAELQLRLAARSDSHAEQMIVAECARQLRGLLLLQRDQQGQLQAVIDAQMPSALLLELQAHYALLFPVVQVEVDATYGPPQAFYDPFLVHLALDNAVHNACRHARSRVSLAVRSEDGGVVFEVCDDGSGFSAEQLTRDPSLPVSPSASGTGLGLYLAARIAALHRLQARHGHVSLHCDAGGVFRLHLP